MARSEYVYVVMQKGSVPPLAAFTVKRELRQMLMRLDKESSSVLPALLAYRMVDGPGGFRAEMSIRDVIDGK